MGQWVPVKERRMVTAGAQISTQEKKTEGKWVLKEKDGEMELEEDKGVEEG